VAVHILDGFWHASIVRYETPRSAQRVFQMADIVLLLGQRELVQIAEKREQILSLSN